MKKIGLLFLSLFFLLSNVFGGIIPIEQARTVAKNKYFEITGINQKTASIAQEMIVSDGETPIYYVFNFKQGGFVIVSAEDKFYPIIGYSAKNTFKTEGQPANVKYWMDTYKKEIEYVRNNEIEVANTNQWQVYNVPFEKFTPQSETSKTVDPLTADILWDQGCGYNDYCPECSGAACGHCWTGCVATAMGIIMKYWNYPIQGEGSHSYYHYPDGVLSANFGDTHYMWSYMENYPNPFVAKLLYHCGVSVEMNYNSDGSGAYSSDAIDAFKNYFRYSSNAQLVSKSDYTESNWINLLKNQLDQNRPVYYSGRDADNFGHAFVCDGYDASNYFHFNFGWSGYTNGFYSIDDVGGFSYGQQAGINIYPGESYYPYQPSVTEITATLDTNDLSDFNVDIEWQEVSNATGYEVYRDDEFIANINSGENTYRDSDGEPGDHYYGIRAIYSNGTSLCAYDILDDATYKVDFFFFDTTGNIVKNVEIIFNNDTATATFGSFTFLDVPFGWNYTYKISHPDYDEITGNIPVLYKDTKLTLILGTPSSVNVLDDKVSVYPNPAENYIFVDGLENFENPQILIYDLNGKLIKHLTVYGKKTAVDIKDLHSGFYQLVIKDANNMVTKKLIVK